MPNARSEAACAPFMCGYAAGPRPPPGPGLRSGPRPVAAVRVRPGAPPPFGRPTVFGRRELPAHREPLLLDDLHRPRPLWAGLAAELPHPDPSARGPLLDRVWSL